MRPLEIEKTAIEFDILPKTAFKARIRYLQDLLSRWNAYIDEQTDVQPESDVIAAVSELIAIRKYQERVKRGVKLEGITDEMIDRARTVPVDRLIDFRKGMAVAFCHDDRTPSLSFNKKTGTCRCWPCGKSYNAVDILMLRDSQTFIEAVKILQEA